MKYQQDKPIRPGYYWVTRECLSFGEIVRIVDDQITGRGLVVFSKPNIHLIGLPTLDDFHSNDMLWAGPIMEPKRNNNVSLPQA